MDVIDDLVTEQDRLAGLLEPLDEQTWLSPSGAPGWSIADVVLHLAQSEEAVVASAGGQDLVSSLPATGNSIDELMDNMVKAQRTDPATVFTRWQKARRAATDSLRATDPDTRLPWAAAPLKPAALATTRLAETWAHGLDITGPLGVAYPDTDRLRHIAWLAHRTLPYGFAVAGEEPHDVFCELTTPDGTSTWTYGDPATESRITGPAGDFCRVGAQRMRVEDCGLVTSGPYAADALRVLRNYAG